MDVYVAPEARHIDLWERYERSFEMFPGHSPREFSMIERFLYRFPIEEEGFNENEDLRWVAFKQRMGGAPDLRNQVLTLLYQIRRTKGYGVNVFIDFSRFPPWSHYGVFTPRNLTNPRFLRMANDAGQAVVDELNRRQNVRPVFTFLGVDKMVTTNQNRLLLSFRATELDVGAEIPSIVYLQAMVDVIGFSIARDEGFPDTFRLTEWKYSPFGARIF